MDRPPERRTEIPATPYQPLQPVVEPVRAALAGWHAECMLMVNAGASGIIQGASVTGMQGALRSSLLRLFVFEISVAE